MAITHITDATFKQEVLEADKPVVVDIYADWCGPCKMLAPLIDAMAEKYEGRVKFVKLNSDENPVTTTEANVRGIPTLLYYIEGQLVDRQVGYLNEQALSEFIEGQL